MKEKVTHLRMHAPLHIIGIGDVGAQLPHPGKSYTLDMSYTEGESVVRVKINNVHARIPLTNIQVFTSASMEQSNPVSSSKAKLVA